MLFSRLCVSGDPTSSATTNKILDATEDKKKAAPSIDGAALVLGYRASSLAIEVTVGIVEEIGHINRLDGVVYYLHLERHLATGFVDFGHTAGSLLSRRRWKDVGNVDHHRIVASYSSTGAGAGRIESV